MQQASHTIYALIKDETGHLLLSSFLKYTLLTMEMVQQSGGGGGEFR